MMHSSVAMTKPLPFPLPSLILLSARSLWESGHLGKIREGEGKGGGFVTATELCIMEVLLAFQTFRARSMAPFSHLPETRAWVRGGEAFSSGWSVVVHSPELQAFVLTFSRVPGIHLYKACTMATDMGLSIYRGT